MAVTPRRDEIPVRSLGHSRRQTVNYWISIDEKGVLTIQETEREP